MTRSTIFEIEDSSMAPFLEKQKISIERGDGVYVRDEEVSRVPDVF